MRNIKHEVENLNLHLLKRQVEKGIFPHAYLFSGEESFVKIAVQYLLNNFLGTNCDKNPDFKIFSSKPISIDDIKTLRSAAYSSPLVSDKNIFLLENIENLSRDAAGAFLKILEEPPVKSLILATTTNKTAVLPTIKSRFAKLHFAVKPKSVKLQKAESIADIDNAIFYTESILRKSPGGNAADILENLLKIKFALRNPVINKRLLGEYFSLITNYIT